MPSSHTEPYSDRPAAATLRKLMAERGHSNRSLARASGLSAGAIGNIASDPPRDRPGVHALTVIADALGVPPEHFAEVRLANARRLLDEREVPLEQALAAYQLLARALTLAELASSADGDELHERLGRMRERWLGAEAEAAAS